jgi:hypothetical protein
VNEQNRYIDQLWDGVNLKCTFRRCVNNRLFNMWEEIMAIASSICLTEEEDEMVWQFHSSGIYSTLQGCDPHLAACCLEIGHPLRVHFFLWLVSKNKLLTRDNLEKRRVADTCLFCAEKEIVCHLLFECVVARRAWEMILVGVRLGQDYESIAKLWLCNTKFGVINIISSAMCWSL